MPYLKSKEKTMPSSLDAIQKILQKTVAPCISDIRERLMVVKGEIRRLDGNLTTTLEIRRRKFAP